MRESIALCERTKNRWGMGTAYRYLGLATLATGQCAEAFRHFQKSLEILGEYFIGWDIARTTKDRACHLLRAREIHPNAEQIQPADARFPSRFLESLADMLILR